MTDGHRITATPVGRFWIPRPERYEEAGHGQLRFERREPDGLDFTDWRCECGESFGASETQAVQHIIEVTGDDE